MSALDRAGESTYLNLATDLLRARRNHLVVRVSSVDRTTVSGAVRTVWIEGGDLHFIIKDGRGEHRFEGGSVSRVRIVFGSPVQR